MTAKLQINAKKFGDLRRGRNRRTAEYEPWLVVEGE
jgi:hypothetical protein